MSALEKTGHWQTVPSERVMHHCTSWYGQKLPFPREALTVKMPQLQALTPENTFANCTSPS